MKRLRDILMEMHITDNQIAIKANWKRYKMMYLLKYDSNPGNVEIYIDWLNKMDKLEKVRARDKQFCKEVMGL